MEITRQQRHGVSFYACSDPAWAGAGHGFSTRLGGVSPAPMDSLNLGANRGDDPVNVRENFVRFCAAAGTDPNALVKNHQIHSDIIRPVGRADVMEHPEAPGSFEADGLVTNESGVCLTIFSGDGTPIRPSAPARGGSAAAPAGGGGPAAGPAARAAEAMVRDYGCAPEHILAAIGPGIGPCCFETHRDVPDGLRVRLGPDAEPFVRPLSREGKFSVDLKGANARWLERAGLAQENIAICSACTACQLDEFWSHRVQGGARGSMAAMIQLV